MWFLFAVVALAGCDARKQNESPAAPPRVVHAGNGTIRGQVKFGGTPPVMKQINMWSCHPGAPATVPDETVVVNGNGTLRNVFVYVEGAEMAQSIPQSQVVLDQVNCRFVPHVIG